MDNEPTEPTDADRAIELVVGEDCEFCTPTREVIAVNSFGARCLGFTHEPECPMHDD
ncbi:hypothetical protein [Arthrobacter sp. efr-133-R2A-63]|uniref:hypothetical protein n=1 Tax=Arthrobacter sp. efr-133-R2A-63 TaxID=3040278 RepID=UPI00254EA487|nr:hypothetical protein [Arthrobacter sp. efr-133-R2A-63]